MQELSKTKQLSKLLSGNVIISEKLAGSSFSFENKGGVINFYKGSYKRPINLVDRTLMKYYEEPISHINNIMNSSGDLIPENTRFNFQYFINTKPNLIRYDNLPENKLVLTHIIESNHGKLNIIQDSGLVNKWSKILKVTPLKPVFNGVLSQSQQRAILDFVNTTVDDHSEIFQSNSFAGYIYELLNPTLKTTTLQDNLSKPIESIIFKFCDNENNTIKSAKIVDPYTVNLIRENLTVYEERISTDINEIILIEFLSFIDNRGLRLHELTSQSHDERYIELVSNIFNDYIDKRGNDVTNIKIESGQFASSKDFNLNLEFIKNRKTKELLNESDAYKNFFKVVLGSLRKKRTSGTIMTNSSLCDFNELVDKINEGLSKEIDTSFKTFNKFISMKNESLEYRNVEELVLEENSIKIKNFINLGKVKIK